MVFWQGQALPLSQRYVNQSAAITGGCDSQRAAPNSKSPWRGKDRFRSSMSTSPRRLGYILVSTRAQTTDRQTEALRAECDALHVEHVSAVADARPVFEGVLAALQPGDTFVVLDLDRAFRSSVDAMLTAELLRHRGISFRILSLQVDTATPEGELFYTLLAAFAQFERRIISRRTREGLAAARNRGQQLGRPRVLTSDQIERAYHRYSIDHQTCRAIAEDLGVARSTLERAFRDQDLPFPLPPQPKGKPP